VCEDEDRESAVDDEDTDLCVRTSGEVLLMCYCFPYFGTNLCKLVIQSGIQQTLLDHGYGLVYHAVCLFTFPAFARYLLQPATEGGLRLSRPRCLILRRGGFPRH